MSGTGTRNRSCTGKTQHADRRAAEVHIRHLALRGTCFGRMTAYKCKHCPGWHVGHKARRRR